MNVLPRIFNVQISSRRDNWRKSVGFVLMLIAFRDLWLICIAVGVSDKEKSCLLIRTRRSYIFSARRRLQSSLLQNFSFLRFRVMTLNGETFALWWDFMGHFCMNFATSQEFVYTSAELASIKSLFTFPEWHLKLFIVWNWKKIHLSLELFQSLESIICMQRGLQR